MTDRPIYPGQTWASRTRKGDTVRVSLVSEQRIGFTTVAGGTAYLAPAKFRARYQRATR